MTDLADLIEVEKDFALEYADITRGLYASAEGHLTTLRAFGGKACTETSVVNVCGAGITDNEGRRTLELEDFVCIRYRSPGAGEGYQYLTSPFYFVATPRTQAPALLTFTFEVQGQDPQTKIRITVSSWDLNGQPRPHTKFDWHCCIQHVIVPFT